MRRVKHEALQPRSTLNQNPINYKSSTPDANSYTVALKTNHVSPTLNSQVISDS